MSQPSTQGELEAESAVTASLSGWGGREVTDLGVKLDLAAEGRVAGLLHVAHQARALRLEAPRVLVHILRRAARSVLNSRAGHSMLNATSTHIIIVTTVRTITGGGRWLYLSRRGRNKHTDKGAQAQARPAALTSAWRPARMVASPCCGAASVM